MNGALMKLTLRDISSALNFRTFLIWIVMAGMLHSDMGPDLFSHVAVLICGSLQRNFLYCFWNNSIWGMVLSIVFIGILIWKAILYVIFLREVADLKGGRMFGAFVVIGYEDPSVKVLKGSLNKNNCLLPGCIAERIDVIIARAFHDRILISIFYCVNCP